MICRDGSDPITLTPTQQSGSAKYTIISMKICSMILLFGALLYDELAKDEFLCDDLLSDDLTMMLFSLMNYYDLTFVSDIHMGAVCCFSRRSVTLVYQLSPCNCRVPAQTNINVKTVRGILFCVKLPVKTWPHNFSSFWHCSSNFLLDM